MEGRPLYRTVAAAGLAAYAVALAVLAVFHPAAPRAMFAGLIVAAVVGIVAALQWEHGIWVTLAVSVAAEVTTFWLIFLVLQLPISALDAGPGLLGFVGVWTALIASVLGAIRRRTPRDFTDRTRRKLLIGAGAVLALSLVSTSLTITNKKTVDDAAAADTTAVAMENGHDFTPKQLTATSGEEARFLVRNDDPVGHTFTVEDYDVMEIVGPGSEVVVTFTPTKAGTLKLVCDFHSDMKGEIVVS